YDYFDDAFWDRKERQEYGYARVRANLADGSTVDTWFHNQDFYRRNLAWKSEHRDAAGDLWVVESADYTLRKVAAQSFFPTLERQQTTWYEGTTLEESGGISTAQTFDYDERGNVTLSETFLDQGPADDLRVTLGYTFDPTLYQVRTETLHAENLEGRTLRRRSATYTPLGDLETLTRYLTGGVDPASGQPYDDAEMVSRYTYRGDGNLETASDESGYTVTLTYDPETATHVTGVEDSFGYTTGHEYDLAYGLPTLTRDENGNELKRVYDGFGRLSQVFAPGDAAGDPTVSLTYAPDARPAYAVTGYDDVTRPGDPLRSALFVDGLERRIQQKQDTTYDDGGTFRDGFMVSGQLTYDVMGRVADQGQPTFSTAPLTTFVAAAPLRPTSFEYDVLDRVRKVTFPQQTATRVDYGIGELDGARRLLRTHVDPLGRTTRFYSNVAGSVIGVARQWTEDGRPTELISRYDYNALQSPLSITDPAGHVTRLDYDTLGRRVVVDDPDAGRTEHRYSLAGNLGAEITSNLAAAGQQIGYRYTFHRLDAIDFPVSPDVAYTYGEPGADCNRANRVVTVSDESGVETRCYSALGQMIESSKLANTIGGRGPLGPYVTRWRYDDLDRLLALTYPDGETLTYGFDAGGRVTSAAGDADGTTTRYVERIGYDQFGTLVQLDYGNGVVHRRSYDPESRFLAGLSATGGSAGRFQNLLFTRDDVGSIERLENDVAALNGPVKNGPVTQSFAYDDLYQLVGAEGTYQQPPNKSSVYTLGLDYDAIGNIERKNQLHTIQSGGGPPVEQMKTTYDWVYEYDGAQPAAPSHVGDRTFDYDGDGNQLGWDSDSTGQRRTVTWNERNRATSVADQGRTTRFLYDAAGQRTNKRGSLGETVYVNEWFSIRNGTIGSKQVFADRLRVATRIVQPPIEPPGDGGDGGGDEDPIEVKKLYYYHPDQLGSTHYVTDEDGELFRHLEYFPFGEGWVDESSVTQRTPYQWISKELDSQTGLYEFGFRFFQPRESQWLSADPILDQLLDTEALARPDLGVLPYRQPGLIYGYSANDPINLYDPTGLAKKNPQVAQRSAKVRRRIARKVHAATAAGTGPLSVVVRGDVRKYARGIRKAQAIQKKVPLGKNVGFGFYNGKVKLLVSGKEPRSGILTPPVARRYNYVHSGFITRDNDTEAQYLEYLAAKLPAGAVGEVLIFTERPPCHSCRGVIQQFKADFPNMSLRVVSKISDSAGKTEWNY
ncbi:MAG TPA: deaminase domain-containing protein, partial [Thermoanaerobaculia bacterium]|nr:deaminase domain-containing protein [Thermoanaerobaculia bacterium]